MNLVIKTYELSGCQSNIINLLRNTADVLIITTFRVLSVKEGLRSGIVILYSCFLFT